MLGIGSCGPKSYISNVGLIFALVCGLVLVGFLVAAMKYCTEWSEDMFNDGARQGEVQNRKN